MVNGGDITACGAGVAGVATARGASGASVTGSVKEAALPGLRPDQSATGAEGATGTATEEDFPGMEVITGLAVRECLGDTDETTSTLGETAAVFGEAGPVKTCWVVLFNAKGGISGTAVNELLTLFLGVTNVLVTVAGD